MEHKEFVGIDVSQATLDVVIRSTGIHKQIANTQAGRKKLLPWLKRMKADLEETLICFENTGIFSLPLLGFLADEKVHYVQISGLEAKRSMGIKRDKTDKVDAAALAQYAYRNREELQPDPPPNKILLAARRLSSLRDLLVRQRAGLKSRLKVEVRMLDLPKRDLGVRMMQKSIKEFTQKIETLEKEILELVNSDQGMKRNYELAISVKGIGPQTATFMLIATANFTLFMNWRKFACYVGIVPFNHRSGTSIERKSRVSMMGNKHGKTLLSSAAASAIQSNSEMKLYFERRVNDGKHKMSTLNIIRNKLVSRVFAAVNRNEPYIDIHKFAA
ncbi:MAG: IS110 family transposase [Flavobacteriales bacterium]|jgi:transposase